ncbi:SGNH/GDSL hydrolase family protein [Bacillus sp. RAR_GA_16]|uniref:SGNH/GDSL hydrolase family protein n=1 Tax=Bacillus sp. RAR_GA_16 TaxID=2876774 RepID=UPI001CCF862F|nr:SGNH/GDSL hydrolase family protein [Bacillus sp. RAR_GA_16]MCA0174085.1 SGNH/GDSL hydrolase family protein [Bacillus sp. RAR_GA_16]
MFNSHTTSVRYIAIGDSITLGTGTVLFTPTFVDFYSGSLHSKLECPVKVRTFAENGATTSDVKRWLSCSQIPMKHSPVITVTAGGNDLIDAAKAYAITKDKAVLEEALHECCLNMSQIVTYLSKELKQNYAHAMIRIVNLYNPIPELTFSDYWVKAFNRHIDSCSTEKFVKVANVFPVFKGREEQLLASDGIHPNTEGHKEIAKVLMETGICL